MNKLNLKDVTKILIDKQKVKLIVFNSGGKYSLVLDTKEYEITKYTYYTLLNERLASEQK